MTTNEINYVDYIEPVKKCFSHQTEILGTELKKKIGMEDKGRLFGSLISALIVKKVITKIENKYEKHRGKPVYYYKLSDNMINQQKANEDWILFDQHGNKYDCPKNKTLKEFATKLLEDNSKLELTAYQKVNTFKAKVNVIEC